MNQRSLILDFQLSVMNSALMKFSWAGSALVKARNAARTVATTREKIMVISDFIFVQPMEGHYFKLPAKRSAGICACPGRIVWQRDALHDRFAPCLRGDFPVFVCGITVGSYYESIGADGDNRGDGLQNIPPA